MVSLMLFAATPAMAAATTVVALGDSLTAGYGLSDLKESWVFLLEQALAPQKIQVINAGVSGDTTAGGRSRLAALLSTYKPRVVIVELGANDGLRGLPLAQMEQNLQAIVDEIKSSGAKPLLLGMQLPAHYGARFNERFAAVYPRLAAQAQIDWLPNFLEGVGDQAGYMQPDGLHPNRAAQPLLRDRVLPHLRGLLN